MKMIVLGAGLVGGPLAIDLAKDYEVAVVDRSGDALANVHRKCPEITAVQADLGDPSNIALLVSDYDFVVNAVPGFMGFATAQAIVEAGKDCVCISFYEEDPFELDPLARENNVTMVADCGVSPGLVNVLIMDAARKLDSVDSVLIYVGGLPEIREWPSEYKAVFSPVDVIEEYTRPARTHRKRPRGRPACPFRSGVRLLSRGWHPGGIQHRRVEDTDQDAQRAQHARKDVALSWPCRKDGRPPRTRVLFQGAKH